MLPYTDAEKNAIKSNLHVGSNRPLAELVITGQPYTITRIKSISVEPIKNGAGQAKIVIDNKDGIFSPGGAGVWNHILWPNNDLTISLGYGVNIECVFAGMIDSIQMKTYPQEITIFARDFMKRALDQTVTDWSGHTLVYLGQTIEEIFIALAASAGWPLDKIICNSSGPIITDIMFSNITYADAMKQLAEMFNYEYYCGRYGEIYFQYAVDRQPEAVDEYATLNDETNVELLNYPIASGSIRVNSAVLMSGTTYVEGIDYIITEGNQNAKWKIKRTAESSIASGQIICVSYVWAAWVFTEGVDIISLGYTIDDTDLYRTVTVIGQTVEDAVCSGSAIYGNADYYNVLADKTLISEDKSARTPEVCSNIANYRAITMATNAREVEFEAVGNPYLWVGDCIMVVESSSTISEIYRIASLSHTYGPKGQPIFSTSITAQYYGYSPGV